MYIYIYGYIYICIDIYMSFEQGFLWSSLRGVVDVRGCIALGSKAFD